MCAYSPMALHRGNIFVEPAHLLPMHHIAKKNKLQSQIFQFGHPSREASIREIRDFKPDVLGLSFVANRHHALDGAHELLGAFSELPNILIGGADPTAVPGRYADEFIKYSGLPKGNMLIIVRGRGEPFISAFTSNDEGTMEGFLMPRIRYRKLDGRYAAEIDDIPFEPFDHNAILRPYDDFSAFHMVANVRWAVGCLGECKFCPPIPAGVDYASPDVALMEIDHLKELGVKAIRMASPDFTVDPDKSSQIVSSLPPMKYGYSFASRIDTFHQAMTRHPAAWKRYSNLSLNQIELGVESFIPERLVRMGKYHSVAKANLHVERLVDIINFFKGSKTPIRLFLIQLDWLMDLAEAETEALKTLSFLEEHYETAYISPDTGVGRIMSFSPGSFYANQMRPIDFFRFERDPRILLLYNRIEMEKEIASDDLANGRIDERDVFLNVSFGMLEYYLECIKYLKEVDPGSIDLDLGLNLLMEQKSYPEIVERLIAGMGPEGKKLEGVFYAAD